MKLRPSSFFVSAAVFALAGAAALAACKASPDQGGIEIITGGDDPFTGPPPATTLNVDGIGADGGVVSLVKGEPVAQETLSLGNYDESLTYAIRVTAFGADGGALAVGESLPIELGALAEATLPIFVQRKGQMALMPETLNDGRQAPLVAILGGRYIFEAGGAADDAGTNTTSNLYDLLEFDPYVDPPTFTPAPTSIGVSDLVVLSINSSGGTLTDLSTGDPATAAALPTGSAGWSDIAGGQSFLGDDGTVYIVGATRDASLPATAAILVISTSQVLTWATLKTARAGAAAGWVSGKGLVVAGGSALGAGVELLGPGGAATATPLSYPADPTTGGGIDGLTASTALYVVGNSARVIDLDCASTCAEQAWTATLPASLTFAQVFDIDASSAFVVGDEADGSTHAFTFSATAAAELPLRVPRTHARAVRLPLGPVAIVGGGSSQLESFTP